MDGLGWVGWPLLGEGRSRFGTGVTLGTRSDRERPGVEGPSDSPTADLREGGPTPHRVRKNGRTKGQGFHSHLPLPRGKDHIGIPSPTDCKTSAGARGRFGVSRDTHLILVGKKSTCRTPSPPQRTGSRVDRPFDPELCFNEPERRWKEGRAPGVTNVLSVSPPLRSDP